MTDPVLYSDSLWAAILRAAAERPMQAQDIRDAVIDPSRPRQDQRRSIWCATRDLKARGWLRSTPRGLIASTEALTALADAHPAPAREDA